MNENYDAFWLYDPQYRYDEEIRHQQHIYARQYGKSAISESIARAMENSESGPYSWLTTSPSPAQLVKDLFKAKLAGGIPPELKKESPIMGYNDYDNDRRSDAQKIDDAVREAIAAPRREAEIAKRVAAVSALEPLKDAKVNTLITFTRKNGRGDKADFVYAALKTADDRWFVTGDGYRTNGEAQTFDGLLSWMTTGDTLAENVQVVTGYEPLVAAA